MKEKIQKPHESPKTDNNKVENHWWQNAIVKDSPILLIGIGIGIITTSYWLLQQEWFYKPLIDNAVRATIASEETILFSPILASQTIEKKPSTISNTQAINITPESDGILSIDSIPMKIYSYSGGVGDPKMGSGWNRFVVFTDEDLINKYLFEYFLPEEGIGYVGLAFDFIEPQDISKYNNIEIKMVIKNDTTRTLLVLSDVMGKKESVLLGMDITPLNGVAIEVNDKEQIFRISLGTRFNPINRKLLKEVDFDCDIGFTQGNQSFTINRISFY